MNEEKAALYVAIPARFASTRLPGKPLLKIGNKTLIELVLERAQQFCDEVMKSSSDQFRSATVVLASDNDEILNVGKKLGCLISKTDPSLASGTDRIFAALSNLTDKPLCSDIILNIQGDEPLFPLAGCKNLVLKMNECDARMGTLVFRRKADARFVKPSVVKVVADSEMNAVYFSRAPIPWPRDLFGASEILSFDKDSQKFPDFWQHIGVYSFRMGALQTFASKLPQNIGLEKMEGLEQLRAVEAGWKIALCESFEEPLGIDTPEDLEIARRILKS